MIATRVAVVAESEELRDSIAAALEESAAFEVVATAATNRALPQSAEVVVVARPTRAAVALRAAAREMPAPPLSHREREILELLADGLGNKQIAARLGISTSTVKTHLETVFEKLGVESRAEAVAQAVRRGQLTL